MATNYTILDYTVKALVEKLMLKYGSSLDSSLELILNSKLYTRLLKEPHLLEEGDIYLFNLLEEEIN